MKTFINSIDLSELMEAKRFVGRKDEMDLLINSLNKQGAELIILYGRRRVGKTRLLEELSKRIHIDLSLMFEEADYTTNLSKFAQKILERYNYPSFEPKTFREAFLSIPENTIIILDEFSYIQTIGEFQAIWEEVCKKKNHKVILCGSMIRIMEDMAYSIKSPLYGRATCIIKLMPLKFAEVVEWYKGEDIEDILTTYFCVGGIPRYLELIDTPGEKEVLNAFVDKNSILLREGKLLLKESFPSSEIYPKIMFALSKGCTEPVKIANEIHIPAQQISKYLLILCDYGFAEKRMPFFGGGKKDVRYYMADPFFEYWIRFAWLNYNEIENGKKIIPTKEQLNSYYGRQFEKTVRESYMKAGTQWGKDYDIDVVAQDGKKLILIECKWQKEVDADEIMRKLTEAGKFISGAKSYTIYAKSYKRKTKDAECYTLKDLR